MKIFLINKSIKVIIYLFLAQITYAENESFIRKYTYQASERDSKELAREYSLEKVKFFLLEEICSFIKSDFTTGRRVSGTDGNYKIEEYDDHKITSIVAGVTQTEILKEKWNGREFYIKARITIDRQNIYDSINKILKNEDKIKELKEIKKRRDKALNEIEILKKQLVEAKSKSEEADIKNKYKGKCDVLILSNWHTKGNYYALNNDFKNAIKYFKKAIEDSPNDKIAYMNLATIYFNQGNTSKGMKYHKKANSLVE